MDQAQSLTYGTITEQYRFSQKVMLLWVSWNFDGIINHFELDQNGAVNAAALYSDSISTLDQSKSRVSTHPAAALIKAKVKELHGIEFLPHSSYSCDLALPSDYHLFHDMAYFF